MKTTPLYNILAFVVIALLSGLTLGSCNTTGCTDNQNSIPLAGIYSYNTGDAISISGIAVGGSGAPNDSLLASPVEAVTQVYLPFRATEPYTTFYITYHQTGLEGQQDQVTFYYESQPWFASEECGAMYHYRITRVAHTFVLLDSVAVTDSLITNVERETIRLYFRTSSSDTPSEETPSQPSTPSGDEEETPSETPDTPADTPADNPTEGDENV